MVAEVPSSDGPCMALFAASKHSAGNDLSPSGRALKVRHSSSISVVNGKSLRVMVERRQALMHEKNVLCKLSVKGMIHQQEYIQILHWYRFTFARPLHGPCFLQLPTGRADRLSSKN